MPTTTDSSVSFEQTSTRSEEMHHTIETWIDELVDDVNAARESEQFQEWLDVQSRFHEYSLQNTLLIKRQCPEATNVAGYNTWREEFDRHVTKEEQAIWIWAPIVARRCPDCQNSPTFHAKSDCAYDETPPEEWSKGLVGFRPVPVFDVSQTEGEPLPELEIAATAQEPVGTLIPALTEVAFELGVTVEIVDADEWAHGNAQGVCQYPPEDNDHPVIKVKAQANQADLAVTMIHEYAHALLHVDMDHEYEPEPERAKREVEAEAVAYIIGRHVGLDTSGSAFYLAAWRGDDSGVIRERLGRISGTAQQIIGALET